MKTKKLLLMFPFLFFVMGMISGCEQCEQHKIYENHDISACGVDDPLRNLDWLTEIYDKKQKTFENIRIDLYCNNETKEDYIVIDLSPLHTGCSKDRRELVPIDPPYWIFVYTCAGERLFTDDSDNVDTQKWYNFFDSGKNTQQGIICKWNKNWVK